MAYEGELLHACPDEMFDFSQAYAVVVSGDGPNVWGHMLLKAGPTYFQIVTGIRATPRYMSEAGYARYLKETGKKELRRFRVPIPHPEKSQLKLEQLLSEPRWWLVWTNNCEGFVEEVVMAGGGPRLHQGPMMLPTLSRPYPPAPRRRSAFEVRHEFPF